MDPLAPILSELSSQRPLSVIEIGTRYGESLKFIALKFRVSHYIAIDAFESYASYHGDPFDEVLNNTDGDQIFLRTQSLGRRLLGRRFQLIRQYSRDAVQSVQDESADFVFIDGNHTFPFVTDDLEKYWPKVQPGGFLCGHDYFMRSTDAGGLFEEPMVFEAVEAFARKNGLAVSTFGEHRGFPMCFAIQKPR